MISIKVKNPKNPEETVEFPSKSKAIIYLVENGIPKPTICKQLSVTHGHIHITMKNHLASIG